MFVFTWSRPDLGPTEPSIQCVLGALSPGVKRPVCEADYSSPSNVQVKNGGAIPPLHHTSSWHGAYFMEDGDRLLPINSGV
jgi:hypothetical protein